MKINQIERDILAERPQLKASLERNRRKRDLALALRAVRKQAGLTQTDVARISGMKQSAISKLESPMGPMPETETIHRYAAACNATAHIGFLSLPATSDDVTEPAEIAKAVI